MVLFRLGLGLAVGITIPQMVNEELYLLMATSFLRPHLKLKYELQIIGKDRAISIEMINSYLKDVISSFFIFFYLTGPWFYHRYILKSQEIPEFIQRI